jgi:N-glycosylase/DNA lyase
MKTLSLRTGQCPKNSNGALSRSERQRLYANYANYAKKKLEIKKRLKEFRKISKDKDMFAELCFCILTPQSKAVHCDRAIKELRKSNLLFKGSISDIKSRLKGLARFHNKKAAYLVAARRVFNNRKLDRDWLVKNIKGLGYKEASHFLRNIGLGRDVAILDVHILRNLKKLGVIKKIPHSLTKKNYMEVEGKMRKFAERVKIPLEELDLLFWSLDTGFVFK